MLRTENNQDGSHSLRQGMQAHLATRQSALESGKQKQPKDFKAKKSGRTCPPRATAKGGVRKSNGKAAVLAAKVAKDKAAAQVAAQADKGGLATVVSGKTTEAIVV